MASSKLDASVKRHNPSTPAHPGPEPPYNQVKFLARGLEIIETSKRITRTWFTLTGVTELAARIALIY